MSLRVRIASLLGIGLLIVLNVVVIARNREPEAIVAKLAESNRYHFDVAPLQLGTYLPLH